MQRSSTRTRRSATTGSRRPAEARDAQAKGGRKTSRKTAGGVDANASKQHLYDVAKRLDISGRSSMSKSELVKAIEKANDRKSAKARRS
jgi:hypothetical protein